MDSQSLNNEKTQFKTAIRNMHSFYSAYMWCTIWIIHARYITQFSIVYPAFYDSFHTLLSHWPKSGSMECVRYVHRAIVSTLHQLQQLWKNVLWNVFCIANRISGQYMWYIKYQHTIATSLNTKYYGQTHLKVTANIFNTKELPSQALNRKETEILL